MLPKSLAGFKGHTSEGRGGEERGRRCGEVKGGRQRRKEGVGRQREDAENFSKNFVSENFSKHTF